MRTICKEGLADFNKHERMDLNCDGAFEQATGEAGTGETYLHDLNDMYQKISAKLLQEMLGSYEKQIINFLNTVRARKPMPRMQQGRLAHMQPMQQPQYQISQLQSNENQMNPQSQPMNMQGSLPSILDEDFRPKMPLQQQTQQNAANLLPSQSQPSEPQPQQQQLMSQIQSQPTQLQQQLGLQQQPNQLQRDLQQRLQASGQGPGSMLQPQSVIDQQKQLYQSQRSLPETSSTSLDSTSSEHANGGDWQEEIKTMKEMYLHDLNDMYQKISLKLLQHDSLPQQLPTEQLEKLKIFKVMLDRIISFLQVSKNDVLPRHKEMLGSYEKQIINFLNTVRARKPMPRMQQGRLAHMQPMQQPQYQISQLQSNENQMNSQLKPMPRMQQGRLAHMQPMQQPQYQISQLQSNENQMNSQFENMV
ncbi:hypothetical protein Tsubulata_034581 [Turnera subulata]|uniref:Mediator complex subunit 15 KIX domain-containing protein n=1 Tax=Turnera subulata TaxID=218843 RepID=A0A9Q0J6A9_9ROSI|nr:hypothetical protein Tsubulata_034581 [Turnera subulata]